MEFERPPQATNMRGETRTVGFEIEFGGIETQQAAEIVAALFCGRLLEHGPFHFQIDTEELGCFSVVLDTRLLQGKKPEGGAIERFEAELSNLVASAASLVLPQEITTPPVAFDRLDELAALVPALRRAGATGTESSVLYAFALHINPEAPSLEAKAVTAILKAFALLSPSLWESIKPDMTRRVLGFAEPFGASYVKKLADEDYWPDLPQLIEDYIDANPTRNRALDVLPLFAWLDEARVRARLPEEKINRRPTFHYRLPDARVSDPNWSLALEWNRWLAVERLAADPNKLRDACAAHNAQQRGGKWRANQAIGSSSA